MNYKSLPQSCCYVLRIGHVFYVGSTSSLNRRIGDHVWRLRRGTHPCGVLQLAWGEAPESHVVEVLEEVDGGRDLLRAAEQRWLDEFSGRVGLANRSLNSRGPCRRPDVAARWADPVWRGEMVQKMRLASGSRVGDGSRRKMSEAKLGSRNHKSRGVWVVVGGERKEFESVSLCAKHLGVSQQLVDQWLKGLTALPGRGRTCRKKHLVGMDIGFL